ncbi:hypothetical protein L228DRAFT_265629 [Xylona heveae TC161]|uniref:Homeobox and C2H2 transcription factor n=1 Tax=Xylona heveae (strain CBS 132557 / TC161) TaxID=1328760 RepID=A0A165INK2_XYLHT|nr:hypothetical protein L228DRAFT_265629 [Xylona heveae TC161]KZF25155.1 hypothetical protein L228DRAFT_265629 [Xylona heveae TC161]
MNFFDFDQASGAQNVADTARDLNQASHNFDCPSHPGHDCLCHHFLLPDLGEDQLGIDTTAPDFSGDGAPGFDDFSSWIPRYYKPDEPCDYCSSRKLECFVTLEGRKECSSCQSLFRQCSLANQHHHRPSGFIDTLHGVAEDSCETEGQATGLRALRSFQGPVPDSPVENTDGQSRRSGARFSRHAVRILKDWLAEHRDRPYPSDLEKDELKRLTGLKRTQISNWLANARRRGKVPSSNNSGSSSTMSSLSEAIDINFSGPAHVGHPSYSEMNPLERWKHSPPENEPASVSAIANALAANALPDRPPESIRGDSRDSSTGSSFSMFRAPSLCSLETSRTHRSSESDLSFGSLFSHTSQHSFGSRGKVEKVDRRRRRRTNVQGAPKPGENRPFQCTFCTDTFKSKYDWQRHEKSLHLSVEKWVCAPQGGLVSTPEGMACTFCHALNPPQGHLDIHNYRSCEEKSMSERTFYRKDHLRQHLRLMHDCELLPSMDTWKAATLDIKSRCGFCNQTFSTWSARTDHLATHFRAGAKMAEWKGTWGFEPAVLALLQNAVPPCMIAQEARSLDPFSASTNAKGSYRPGKYSSGTSTPHIENSESQSVDTSNLTCFQRVELALSRLVERQKALGAPITDEMLQSHARITVYENDDKWNATPADHPEWLYHFKVAHGLIADDGKGYGGGGGTGGGGGAHRVSNLTRGLSRHPPPPPPIQKRADWMNIDGIPKGIGGGRGGDFSRRAAAGAGTTAKEAFHPIAVTAGGLAAPGPTTSLDVFGTSAPSPHVQVVQQDSTWPTTLDLDLDAHDLGHGLDLGLGLGAGLDTGLHTGLDTGLGFGTGAGTGAGAGAGADTAPFDMDMIDDIDVHMQGVGLDWTS